MWQTRLSELKADYLRKNPRRIGGDPDNYFEKHYFALDTLVDEMQSKIEGVLRTHEMNFLESYRHHMRHITRELDKYKKAINEKEFMGRRDDKVVKLEENLKWFKEEALSLSKLNLKLKEENFVLKQQEIILREEKSIAEAAA